MDELGTLIVLAMLFTFGTPFLLLVIGLVKRGQDKPESAKVFFIMAAAWLIVGGGICASLIL